MRATVNFRTFSAPFIRDVAIFDGEIEVYPHNGMLCINRKRGDFMRTEKMYNMDEVSHVDIREEV